MNEKDETELSQEIISSGGLEEGIFSACLISGDYEGMKDVAVLMPKNKSVFKMNSQVIDQLSSEPKTYLTFDSQKDTV